MFDRFTGTTMVNQANVTVIAYPSGVDEYSIIVYVNGSRAYSGRASLPATVSFKREA